MPEPVTACSTPTGFRVARPAPDPAPFETPEACALPGKSGVQQHRDNLRMVEVIDRLYETPEARRTRPEYTALLLELHALCATKELYDILVSTYGF
jgi:hypothetical protein